MGERAWGRVRGRPADARDRGERTGRARLGSGRKEEGQAGGRVKCRVRWEVMCPGTGKAIEVREGGTDADPFR